MNIWIDLSNSPHVLFFQPIIEELMNRGHRVFVTHRDFAQTSKLCKLYSIDSTLIGTHGGQGIWKKIRNIWGRASQLREFARGKSIDVAVSHNSYAHCIAAKMQRIRYITMMDYEYQPANHISFRLADEILVPFTFDLQEIRKYGATKKKLVKYPGLKEDIYLWQFARDDRFWQKEFPELDSSKIMCTIRPPATMAAYHNFENPIFNELLQFLITKGDVQIIFFPRTVQQRQEFIARFPQIFMPAKSVDGGQLIANSDLIISAGGTMNREAAVLGTPAYTIYAGKMGSVDRHLMKKGKIQLIETRDDFPNITLQKKIYEKQNVAKNVFDFIISRITSSKH